MFIDLVDFGAIGVHSLLKGFLVVEKKLREVMLNLTRERRDKSWVVELVFDLHTAVLLLQEFGSLAQEVD